jgi:hypothetical protein
MKAERTHIDRFRARTPDRPDGSNAALRDLISEWQKIDLDWQKSDDCLPKVIRSAMYFPGTQNLHVALPANQRAQ